MTRILSVSCFLVTHADFLLNFFYAIGFVERPIVPTSINSGRIVSTIDAVAIDVLLLAQFALQHVLIARHTFKRSWARFVADAIERNIYVLSARLALQFLYLQWSGPGGLAALFKGIPRAYRNVELAPLRLLVMLCGRIRAIYARHEWSTRRVLPPPVGLLIRRS